MVNSIHVQTHAHMSIYRANLKIVRELQDYQAQGRTLGNLGNTYYLLGNYKKAIKFHEEVNMSDQPLGGLYSHLNACRDTTTPRQTHTHLMIQSAMYIYSVQTF